MFIEDIPLQVLALKNAAGVSVLEQFALWARAALDNRPFPAAMDLVRTWTSTYQGVVYMPVCVTEA